MNTLFAYLLSLLFFLSALFSVIELNSFVSISRLVSPDKLLSNSRNPALDGNNSITHDNLYVIANDYERASTLPLTIPDIGYRSARVLYRAGILERDENQRIATFCRALSQLGNAIKREPKNSKLLINWANLRQILAGIKCEEPLTEGDFQSVAQYALSRDPINSSVLFSAAQVFLWAQNTETATQLLKRFLEFSQEIRERQYDFIDRMLTSADQIKSIIPAQFPQIVEWSKRIQDKNPTLFSEASSEIGGLQLEAMLKNEAGFKGGIVPSELYFNRLSALLNVVSSSRVRQKIDAEMSRYYGSRGQEKVQKYLETRRTLETTDVIRSVIFGDTRPLKMPFVEWEPQRSVAMDTFYTSVGFFLPNNMIADYIEIVGDQRTPSLSTVAFKVYVSDDNFHWEDVTRDVSIDSLEFADRFRVVIGMRSSSRRYYKIHFASSSRNGRFVNNLANIIQVYGQRVN